eukprot:7125368-Alexandrium_andersonii.AAC.1
MVVIKAVIAREDYLGDSGWDVQATERFTEKGPEQVLVGYVRVPGAAAERTARKRGHSGIFLERIRREEPTLPP